MKHEREPMKYPFVTRRDVIARLSSDPAFVRECIGVLHRRFLERETLKPPAGWMSSHVKTGEDLYLRLMARNCRDADVARARELVTRYAKQLARVLRDEQIARDPQLALVATVFGITSSRDVDGREASDARPVDDVGATDTPSAERDTVDSPSDASVATEKARAPARLPDDSQPRRRQGRPPGSKNKAKGAGPRRKPAARRRR